MQGSTHAFTALLTVLLSRFDMLQPTAWKLRYQYALEIRRGEQRTAWMAIASAWLTRIAVVPLSKMAVVAVTFAVMPPTATLSSPTVQYLRVRHVLCQTRLPPAGSTTHSHTTRAVQAWDLGAGLHNHGEIAQHIVAQTCSYQQSKLYLQLLANTNEECLLKTPPP